MGLPGFLLFSCLAWKRNDPAMGERSKRLIVLGPKEEIQNPSLQILSREGFSLQIEEDSYRAFLAFLEGPPCAVLLFPDAFMEEELLMIRHFKKESPSTPIFVLAVEEGKEAGFKALQNGADSFLPLPILQGEMEFLISRFSRTLPLSSSCAGEDELEDLLESIAGGVAHWVNNPLTTILGWAGLLLKSAKPGEEYNALRSILREGQRIQSIVRSLEGFSRRMEVKKAPLDLNGLVKEFIESKEKKGEILLHGKLEKEIPWVQGDREKILLVFQELYQNAVSNSPKGSSLEISTCRNGSRIEVNFSDEGCGIAERNQGRLFLPFFTIKAHGTKPGLGLALCRGIMKAHGGEIKVESRPGKGSRFILVFSTISSAAETSQGVLADD